MPAKGRTIARWFPAASGAGEEVEHSACGAPRPSPAADCESPSAVHYRRATIEPSDAEREKVDLTPLKLSETLALEAARVLNYQPFVVTPELQTGVAYSIVHAADARVSPPLVFHRSAWSDEDWKKISSSNQSQRTMYDTFVEAVALRYPGGSLLDVACNNGYIPVAARKAGMGACAGMDLGPQYRESIKFLNKVLGTDVDFFQRCYSPVNRCAEPLRRKYDVVWVSAILCHLPDPLNFLSYVASLANEAVFFWGQVVDTEHFVIAYNKPHPNLGDLRAFPYHFNDNTRVSMGLLKHALMSLGFSQAMEISYPSWLPENLEPGVESELAHGSRHRALLFMRE